MSAIEQEYGPPLHMSLDVYWDWRGSQELRYEYANGVVYAMTGASRGHNVVGSNMHALLWNAAAGHDCFVSMADMALYVAASNKVYYPDVMVTCPPGTDDRYETSPCLVVEVLSPSTQGRDRTIKLGDYCTIPELKTYLMVSADADDQFVIQHRNAGAIWIHTVHGPDDEITLTCPSVTFRVSDLYR